MLAQLVGIDIKKPAVLFCIGWAVVLLTLWILLLPEWPTFIHMWRVELYASVFLLAALSYLIYRYRHDAAAISISREEIRYIIVPISAFILWSAASMLWAPSWKSAMHHTLVWSEYLIFYLIVRQILESEGGYNKLITTLTLTLILFSLSAVAEYCSTQIFGSTVNVGMKNAKYGEQVNAVLPLIIVGVVRLRGKQFMLGLLAVAALWLLVFCSLARINLLLFAAAVIATTALIFAFRRFHRYRLKTALVVLTIILTPLPLHIFSLFSSTADAPIARRARNTERATGSNNFRKLMAAVSFEMLSENPVTGIGADNFGFQVNNYRAMYSAANPESVNLAEAEGEIPERAHNEFLQIVAELGVVGGLFVLWILSAVALMAFRAVRNKASSFAVAAVFGLGIFLASSLVSSYSFRLIQNGFVFFFVLAVAAKLLLKPKSPEMSVEAGPTALKPAFAAGIVVCLLLAGYCITRVGSVIVTRMAVARPELEQAIPLYDLAMTLDNENPDSQFSLGLRLANEGRYTEGIPFIAEAIRIGRATSTEFSYLATLQALGGDLTGAEKTLEQALSLYPRSTFVLTRYAGILRDNGKFEESAKHLDRALKINERTANTWWLMINEGPRAASERAARDENFVEVMDLTPTPAIYAIVAEREIRYPNERDKFSGL